MAARRPARRFLVSQALTKGTRDKYLRAVADFLSWADDLGEEPANLSELDELGCDFIQHLYDTNQGRSRASNLLFSSFSCPEPNDGCT